APALQSCKQIGSHRHADTLVVVYRWTIRGAGRGQRLRSAVNRRQWSRLPRSRRDSHFCQHRLLENHVFGPDEIRVLTTAFEDTLRTLRLVDRADPATEIIARKIIELAAQGERDPVRLRERAIQSLSQ